MFVAFEGTDDSMVGWHEDFDMMHTFPIPSQKLAMEYLNQVITRKYHRVYVGGHSKGGNLAMTACMYLPFWKQHKVKTNLQQRWTWLSKRRIRIERV